MVHQANSTDRQDPGIAHAVNLAAIDQEASRRAAIDHGVAVTVWPDGDQRGRGLKPVATLHQASVDAETASLPQHAVVHVLITNPAHCLTR